MFQALSMGLTAFRDGENNQAILLKRRTTSTTGLIKYMASYISSYRFRLKYLGNHPRLSISSKPFRIPYLNNLRQQKTSAKIVLILAITPTVTQYFRDQP